MPRAGLDAEAVVTAAAELADTESLEAVTLARLAHRLGVRSPSLYGHIAGLDDLRRRLGARGARELAGALTVAAAGRSRLAALRAVAETYREYARSHPGTYAAMQRAPDDDSGEAASAGRELVAVIVAVLDGYALRGDEAIHAVRVVRAALHGFTLLESEGGFRLPISLEDSYQRLIGVLDRGLADGVFAG
ncbi:MAG TPA: TetR-like C-terminal domain-containing protein [Solirubrobacteraceae bacterium]|jgi:AcrR family transcriptional regulator